MCVCTDVRLPCSQLEDKGGGQVCVNANIILFPLLSGFIDALILAFPAHKTAWQGTWSSRWKVPSEPRWKKIIINFKVCLNMWRWLWDRLGLEAKQYWRTRCHKVKSWEDYCEAYYGRLFERQNVEMTNNCENACKADWGISMEKIKDEM